MRIAHQIRLSRAQIIQNKTATWISCKTSWPTNESWVAIDEECTHTTGQKCVDLLGLTTAASAEEVRIHKKISGSGTTTPIISNKEMKDIIRSIQDSVLLIKGVTQTIENETKEQRGGFLGMLLCISGSRLLGNMLPDEGVIRGSDGVIRVGQDF